MPTCEGKLDMIFWGFIVVAILAAVFLGMNGFWLHDLKKHVTHPEKIAHLQNQVLFNWIIFGLLIAAIVGMMVYKFRAKIRAVGTAAYSKLRSMRK